MEEGSSINPFFTPSLMKILHPLIQGLLNYVTYNLSSNKLSSHGQAHT
jgi:hypothetical protein